MTAIIIVLEGIAIDSVLTISKKAEERSQIADMRAVETLNQVN